MIRGRPIRFLVTMVGGWAAMRVVTVIPLPATTFSPHPAVMEQRVIQRRVARMALRPSSHGDVAGQMLGHAKGSGIGIGPNANANPSASAALWSRPMPVPHGLTVAPAMSPNGVDADVAGTRGWSSGIADSLLEAQLAFARTPRPPLAFALASFAPGSGLSPGEAGAPTGRPASGRWSGVAWMIWRQNADRGRVLLGGSQAGARIDYMLSPSSPFRPTLYGRAASALRGIAGAEVAAGVAISPRLPFPAIIAVERRQAISAGGRSDFAILAAGGINPMPVGHGFRLDGYGQTGFVGANRRDAFADGRLTLERPIGGAAGGGIGHRFAVGAAIWGGAQPGVRRLDIGPQVSVRVRMGGATMRLGAEWRAQVAGNASPSSGPALSIGTNF